MIDVSDYDQFDYDYSTYWREREYENISEKNILYKLFEEKRGKWFLDIGGSYGRLTSTYHERYNNPIILDYSLKTLQRNFNIIRSKYPNTQMIAANAYKMPFRSDIFDGALMVRVLHHIESPETYFKELKRVLNTDSTYIQEYANKVHIKAAIRGLLRFNFDIFSKEPYKQPIAGNKEGTEDEQEGIFYNYHPRHIKEMLLSNGFNVERKYGCSFLRSPFIKKLINTNLMIGIEKTMQATMSWSNISPSIFLENTLKKKVLENINTASLEDILVCPSCKSDLNFDGDEARCKKCKKSFLRKENIWDFRIK